MVQIQFLEEKKPRSDPQLSFGIGVNFQGQEEVVEMMEPDALQNFMVRESEIRGTKGDKADWKWSGTF